MFSLMNYLISVCFSFYISVHTCFYISSWIYFDITFCISTVIQNVSRGQLFTYWLIVIRTHRSTIHALLQHRRAEPL